MLIHPELLSEADDHLIRRAVLGALEKQLGAARRKRALRIKRVKRVKPSKNSGYSSKGTRLEAIEL
jgi:hypothetical protein